VCEWLAWILRMSRQPEVDRVTSRRRSSSRIRRQSTREEDASSYSLHGQLQQLANVDETNGNNSGSRADWHWLPRPRSTSLCRRGSTRSAAALRRTASRIGDNDGTSPWCRAKLQTTPADPETGEESRSTRLLSSILEELRQLTGKVDRDELKQEEVNDNSSRKYCGTEDRDRDRDSDKPQVQTTYEKDELNQGRSKMRLMTYENL